MYLLLDENNIVRCMASEECNLHKNKVAAGMRKVEANYGGICGDKYDPNAKEWEAHPENYPQPTEAELQEKLIQDEIAQLTREQAIQNLKDRGELFSEYENKP